MQPQTAAEELTLIRAEIARLRAREAELAEVVLRTAALPRVTRMQTKPLVSKRERVFDPRLLPAEILLDPAYSREKITGTTTEAPRQEPHRMQVSAPLQARFGSH
ncbi:hypothetical protein [Rhodobacter maris]|uniref:Uncharacterized protein n=1 Tax=Rhodobacter maris TaxID=446682 RepID=A0A285SB48_9RHOB|nr:hypothetical protein [Rhodobacter maris]SOC04854.1 hypothetical protein SAMN05877831_10445 [Rhodobacter maris]